MGSARRHLIVVSNRGPVSYSRDSEGARVARRGGGGLATALRGLAAHHDVTWIASAMSDEDRVVAASGEVEEQDRNGAPYRLRLVAHDPAAYDGFYNVVANGALWFVQHYLWGLATVPDLGAAFRVGWTDGYEPVNRAFAEAVVEELDRDPAAAVCFHDYHLYLSPRFVREQRPEARLTHFVHIPWPQADYWHVLPADVRRAVHEGLCANDVVGFHTARWRRSFLESCVAIVGLEPDVEQGLVRSEGRSTHVVARPISIDTAEFDELAQAAAVLEEERRIVETRPELLVVRVDRTDPSKNVLRGFRAFGLLLERHPELVGRVAMLALLDPSRQGLTEYSDYLVAIKREAQAVNERHAGASRPPVELQIGDNFPQAVAAYKQFDVLLVNPIFDGMNLVAKEGPLLNERDGVVILSENAGAHEELGAWTVTVNPFDLEQQAEALYRALTMPAEERRRRAAAIVAYVREHDVEAWIRDQLADLDRVAEPVPEHLGSPQ